MKLLVVSGGDRKQTSKRAPYEIQTQIPIDPNKLWTARDYVAHFAKAYTAQDPSRVNADVARELDLLMEWMNYVDGIAEAEFSLARIAIELRLYHTVGSNLRHFRQTFVRNDPCGRGLVAAATSIASWPGAPPVCANTVKVATAVERVAAVGWHQDSLWHRVTHWLQPHYAQAVAHELMLCENRLRHQQRVADDTEVQVAGEQCMHKPSRLPRLPVEVWQHILVFTLPCEAPAAFAKPLRVHRIVAARRKAQKTFDELMAKNEAKHRSQRKKDAEEAQRKKGEAAA